MSTTVTSSQRYLEAQIFSAFLEAHPSFAGETLKEWHQPQPENGWPDVHCTTVSGRRIGIELGGWVNQAEIAAAKANEAISESILRAIGEQPDNECKNILFVSLNPKGRIRIKPGDELAFGRQLFRLIGETDSKWVDHRLWRYPRGSVCSDFSSYLPLGKYLSEVRFHPRQCWQGPPPDGPFFLDTWPPSQPWIGLLPRMDVYSESVMLEPLRKVLNDKIGKYNERPPDTDEFYLLIHYDQAHLYNSPVVDFEEAADRAIQWIGDDPGPYRKIFLFLALTPGERVVQLF